VLKRRSCHHGRWISTGLSQSGHCSRRLVAAMKRTPNTSMSHGMGMFPPNSPPSTAAAAPASSQAGDADLTSFTELRPASGAPGSPTHRSNEISASPSLRSPHTDPNLHMLCPVCYNELRAGGYYSCSGSSAGHGHSTVCVPCFSSPQARRTECLYLPCMAARGQEELTGNHVVALSLKFGDGLPAVRLGESAPMM